MIDRIPQPIATAPRETDTSIQLFCPDQGGWHCGEWWAIDGARWVAAIDAGIELHPTHWLPAEPDPMTASEIIAWTLKRATSPTEQ